MRRPPVRLRFGRVDNVHFEGTVFSDAHLENADLDNSHLEETFLDGAHFENAAVDGTHFDNAHEIKKSHFKGAEADIRTVWPAGFDPAKAGVETIQRDISSEWEGIS